MKIAHWLLALCILVLANAAFAQTTQFSYQGQLEDAGIPAHGSYDFEFRLFGSAAGDGQIGAMAPRHGVAVSDGVFSVSLDFGNQFPGADRFLEIRVRPSGGGGFTVLDPRQKLASAPYAIRSLNAQSAAQLGGVNASQYVVTTDPRMTDARPPTAGSGNYIQNTETQQAATSFNIDGTGQADILRADTQFNLGADRILSNPGSGNLFVGIGAGLDNTTGNWNSFSGRIAGRRNTTGSSNSFFGGESGYFNTTGNGNSFFGSSSGRSNTTGSHNTLIGASTSVATHNLTYATAIGAYARASLSNSVYLGRPDGEDTVRIPGGLVVAGTTSLNGSMAVAGGASAIFTGAVFMPNLPGGGGTSTVCRNGSNQLATCSSSLRYKDDIADFRPGLDLIRHLRPVSFTWIDGGVADVGLVAEEVADIAPLLATYDGNGVIEGVKYDRIGVVLVNAVNQQQAMLEKQTAQIEHLTARMEAQQQRIAALMRMLCETHPEKSACR